VNYGDIKTRVSDAIGGNDGTDLVPEIARWVLDAITDVHSVTQWPWDKKQTTIRIRASVTGTATWTLDDLSIVLDTGNVATQALADEYTNGLILMGGEVYTVDSYTQATSTIVPSAPTVTAGTALAFTMIQDLHTLDATVESVVEVVDLKNNRRLRAIGPNARHRMYPDPFDSLGAQPQDWWVRGVDDLGNVELGVYPPASVDTLLLVEYYRRPVLPSADGDNIEAITGIPDRFHPVIVARAKSKAFEFERENGDVRARADFEYDQGIRRMKALADADTGRLLQAESDRISAYRNPLSPKRLVGQ